MIGIELVEGAVQKIVQAGLEKGLILLGGGHNRNVLTLSPPLAITDEQLSFSVDTLGELFESL